MKPTSQTNQGQEAARAPFSCSAPAKLTPTTSTARPAARGTALSGLALLALGLAAGVWLSGCTVTYVGPPPPPPPDVPPVVVEETAYVGFAPPMVEVDYYFVGGRYAYWHPAYHCWFYRPYAWRPPGSVHVKPVGNLRELNAYHRPAAAPRPEARPQPGRMEERKAEPQRKEARPAPQGQPAKKEEKKKD